MAYTKEYWTNKEKKAAAALEHTVQMQEKFEADTLNSTAKTIIYDESFTDRLNENTMDIQVVDMDSVSAVLKFTEKDVKTAVLNFSSYKEPGGKFLNGSSAQEESLCHESNLYNILVNFMDKFYEKNVAAKNKALYLNRALYTPDVVFQRGNKTTCCDVITCAAPNKTAAQKYCNVSDNENYQVLKDRIRYVLSIASAQNVETLILGAYGCGVFGQSAFEVSTIFKQFLENGSYSFKKVIFAVPDHKNGNLAQFKKTFGVK